MEEHSARIVSLKAVTSTLTQHPFNCKQQEEYEDYEPLFSYQFLLTVAMEQDSRYLLARCSSSRNLDSA